MTALSTFKKIAGSAALAIGLGAAALAPAPAMAQSFGFSFGNDQGRFGFQIGDDDFRPGNRCIARSRIDNRIADQGYRNVRITDFGRRVTEATAVRGGWRYALLVNSCTGRIIDRDRLRRI